MAQPNVYDEVQIKSKQCRVCLGSQGFIPIFGDEKLPDISIELMIFGRVEVHRDDNFPKLLCKECFSLLNGAVSFRKTATRSDAILRDRNKERNGNNLFCISKTDNTCPPKIDEKWLHIFIEEVFVESNTTDQDTALNPLAEADKDNNKKSCKAQSDLHLSIQQVKVKKEIKSNDKINNKKEPMTVIAAKEERREYVKRNQDFNLTDDLLKHMQQDCDTATIKRRECPICKKMLHPDYLNKHIKCKHSGLKKQTPNRKIECPECKKVFSTQRYYKDHIKTHNGSKGDYICDVCGKQFIFQSALINHKIIHSTDLPYKCDHCPYRGRNKHLLRIHTQTHTGEYPFKCDHCNTRCRTKSNLNMHMQRHTDAVDFHCDSCNRGFYSKLKLEHHISAIHLGIKNHLCNLCGAAFGYKHGLMKHMRKVHKIIKGKPHNALYLRFQSEGVLQDST